MKKILFLILFSFNFNSNAQPDFQVLNAKVDFSDKLHTWDGFGVNYVETSQTLNYDEYAQDYGGFDILSAKERDDITKLVFGEDGLKVNILKMFLDPFHQNEQGEIYDHKTTTESMRYFARQGKEIINKRGGEMEIITTLYGPPPYMNTIGRMRGRDLNPANKTDLADYMVDWVRFLREEEQLPVKYLSLHNEGEDWGRMPVDGRFENSTHRHLDYNMYWPPEQVVGFLKLMPRKLETAGLGEIGITPGEGTNWYRFNSMGYAKAIADDTEALRSMGLITSHGFYNGRFWRLFSGTTNHGTWRLQQLRPELKAWTTSMSWMNSTLDFVNLIYYHIYLARVNSVIPWAFIQRPQLWEKGDPNPGNAFTVFEDSTYTITQGYYLYKQLTQAGQPGMAVTYTESMDPSVYLFAFSSNDTRNPDAFVITNNGYSFVGQADAIEINLNVDGVRKTVFLNHKEPVTGNARNAPEIREGMKLSSEVTEKGYILEASIPWNAIGKMPSAVNSLKMDFQLVSGAEDLENVVGWLPQPRDNKELAEVLTGRESDETHIVKTAAAPQINGKKEELWNRADPFRINYPRLEDAQFELEGKIHIMYDDENIYILAEVTDESNLKHKRLAVEMEGTQYDVFDAYRTSYDGEEYKYIGQFSKESGMIYYDSPSHSVTTFFGVK